MFTGELPFKGDSPFSIAMKHVQDDPPEPRAIHQDVPEDLEKVILRCLQKRPDDRYKQMSHLQAELYRVSASSKAVYVDLLATKGPGKNNYPFLDADPSRLAALLVGHISRYYSLLAPCHTGASTPKNGHLFLPGP